jgi:hypothetical protein
VYDGASIPDCTHVDKTEWSYNNGQLLAGAAYLYNYVSRRGLFTVDKWEPEVEIES